MGNNTSKQTINIYKTYLAKFVTVYSFIEQVLNNAQHATDVFKKALDVSIYV